MYDVVGLGCSCLDFFGVVPRLPGLDEEIEMLQSVQQGGGTWARQGLDAFEVMAPRLRGSEIDETTWNEGLAVWRDPAYRFLSPVNIGVWGRKPG